MRAIVRVLIVASAVAAVASSAASAAAPVPDSHDRALALALGRKVATFRALKDETDPTSSLNDCAYFKKHPDAAFGAIFALLPVLVAELVNDHRAELTDLRTTLVNLKPHSSLFRRWAAAEGATFTMILKYDNHGMKVDDCEAATVLSAKNPSPADVKRVTGLEMSVLLSLFSDESGAISDRLAKLNPKMRAFFLAAGVPRIDAVDMTKT